MSLLRTFRINATGSYDGTTVISGPYTPQTNAKEPLMTRTQAAIGRLSFTELCRSGSTAGLFRIRSYGIDGLVATVRALNTSENDQLTNPDDPVAIGANTALQSISVTSEWSVPVQVGASDALQLVGPRGTVEIQFMDMNGSELLTYWNAVASAPPATPISFLNITADTELAPWAGLLFVLFDPTGTPTAITLPAAADMVAPATLVLAKVGGLWGTVSATEAINGGTDPLVIDENRVTIINYLAGQWVATDAAPSSTQTVTNDTSGATVLLPVINGTQVVQVRFTQDGVLKLPATSQVAIGARYVLLRNGDNTSSPFIPARCRLIVNDAAEQLNGVADDFADLSPNGSILLVERIARGWFVTDNGGSRPRPVQTSTGNVTFASGWQGTRYIRNTSAGAMTYTLPPAAKTPIGCRLVAVDEGAGGMTLSSPDVNIIAGGASAGVLTGAQYVPRIVEFNGSNWIST